MDRPLFRRRQYIIHRQFQLGALFSVFASMLLYILALGFLIFYPLYQEFTAAATLQEETMLAQVLIELHRRLWPAVGLIVLLVGLQVVFATHRIAGPLYRVHRALQALIAGEYQHRIRLRKRDQFKEFEGLINQLAEMLEKAREQSREVRSTVHTELGALEALLEVDGHLSGEARRLIGELRGGLKRAEEYQHQTASREGEPHT